MYPGVYGSLDPLYLSAFTRTMDLRREADAARRARAVRKARYAGR